MLTTHFTLGRSRSVTRRQLITALLLLLPVITLSAVLSPVVRPALAGAEESADKQAGGGIQTPLASGAADAYGKLPLQFEANRGQTDDRVRFVSRGDGYVLFLTSEEAV
jgi:hypothetical protein